MIEIWFHHSIKCIYYLLSSAYFLRFHDRFFTECRYREFSSAGIILSTSTIQHKIYKRYRKGDLNIKSFYLYVHGFFFFLCYNFLIISLFYGNIPIPFFFFLYLYCRHTLSIPVFIFSRTVSIISRNSPTCIYVKYIARESLRNKTLYTFIIIILHRAYSIS